MIRRALLLAILLLLSCKDAAPAGDPFDRAEEAVGRAEFAKAAELFAEAAQSERDPVRRAKAEIRLANIEWRVFAKHDAARTRLQRVAAGEHEVFPAKLELARVAFDRKDHDGARAAARDAMASAKTRRDRRRATSALAKIVLEKPRPDELRPTIASLRGVIAEAGPSTAVTRLLLKAAVLAGDGAAAMEAIDGYYHVSQFSRPPSALAAAHAALARVLPAWRGGDAERAAIAEGLGGMRFFEEAALVSRDRSTPLVAYAETIERIEKLINDYYRQMANDEEDDDDLKDGIDRELRALWPRLSKEKYDRERAEAELARRFGTYLILGNTGGFEDAHFAHVVADRTLAVEQYGRKASLRFVELDSVVSNGFGTFLSDDNGGDGGWATETAIYQVRPYYADAPLREWQRLYDDEVRAENERETAEETARDRERAKRQPIGFFAGLAHRLRNQALARVAAASRTREDFLARLEKETFQSSILLHEGRHAIDKLSKERFKTWELEYRAKLSEIALADAPRAALQSVFDNTVGGTSPHGKANEELAKGIVAWMERNRAAIDGLDSTMPLMPQMDRLSDEQIRAAVRGLDPIA